MSELTTLDTVKTELSLQSSGDDSYLERKIKVYSDLFVELVGRDLHWETNISETVAVYPDRRRLTVRRRPVDTINSIKDPSDETVDADDYFLEDPESGFIARETGAWTHTAAGEDNIRQSPKSQPLREYTVDYDAGYVTPEQADNDQSLTRDLPYDIEDAVISAVVAGYTQKGVDSAVTSISVGDGSTSFSSDGFSEALGRRVPQYFAAIAKKYRSVAVM